MHKFAVIALLAASQMFAQRGGSDWMTIGNDAQRSSWVRSDGKISPDSMRKPGFQMVWKVKLKNDPRQLQSITPPALLDFYIGYRGFRSLGFFAGASGGVTGIDIDLARVEWEKSFAAAPPATGGTIPCPGGMTASVTRPTFTGYPPTGPGGGRGRGGPAKSGVGEPLEGAVTLRDVRPPQQPPTPPPGAANRRTAPVGNPFGRAPQFIVALAADGKLHSMYVSNGEEPNPPVDFLPANAHAVGLIVFDNTAYVATTNSCGGVDNGVWALDRESKKVTQWKATAPVAGTMGFAAGPEGMIYAASGSELTALEPKTLAVKGVYKAGAMFSSSPVVFEQSGKDLVAAATADGQIHVIDGTTLNGLAKVALPSASGYAVGALTSWLDASGARWIASPGTGGVTAFKLFEEGGAVKLQQGWTSRELVSPLTPVVVNGVVFALSSGEFRSNDGNVTAAQRVQRSQKAVLYALDAATGKELWSSGSTIATLVRTGGLAAGGGRVYVGGHDGTQYAFSFPMEH